MSRISRAQSCVTASKKQTNSKTDLFNSILILDQANEKYSGLHVIKNSK